MKEIFQIKNDKRMTLRITQRTNEKVKMGKIQYIFILLKVETKNFNIT